MPKLVVLIGNVASGKSTYCKQAAAHGSIIVNDDSITNAVHAGLYTQYDKSLKPLYKSVENTIIQLGLALGRNVIIDRPNIRRASRRRYIGLAHSLDAIVELVMFPREIPEIHAQRRANHDARGYNYDYWLKAAQVFDTKFEPPTADEGYDEITQWE